MRVDWDWSRRGFEILLVFGTISCFICFALIFCTLRQHTVQLQYAQQIIDTNKASRSRNSNMKVNENLSTLMQIKVLLLSVFIKSTIFSSVPANECKKILFKNVQIYFCRGFVQKSWSILEYPYLVGQCSLCFRVIFRLGPWYQRKAFPEQHLRHANSNETKIL